MLKSDQDRNSVIFTLSPLKCEVEAILEETGAFLTQNSLNDLNGVKLLLRELLMNAVEHGNQGEAKRQIFCEVDCRPAVRLKITVEDQGTGFKPESIDMSLPEIPKRFDHRGYVLIKALSDRLEFNEKANRVTAHITIPVSKAEPPGSRDHSSSGDAAFSRSEQLAKAPHKLSGELD